MIDSLPAEVATIKAKVDHLSAQVTEHANKSRNSQAAIYGEITELKSDVSELKEGYAKWTTTVAKLDELFNKLEIHLDDTSKKAMRGDWAFKFLAFSGAILMSGFLIAFIVFVVHGGLKL